MKIGLPSVEATDSLRDYLERCGCIVARINSHTLEAGPPPRSLEAHYAQIELEAYLRVWRELNPEVEVEILPRLVTTG